MLICTISCNMTQQHRLEAWSWPSMTSKEAVESAHAVWCKGCEDVIADTAMSKTQDILKDKTIGDVRLMILQ